MIPFTDIILVLLILFIITTPILLQTSLKVNLPNVSKSTNVSDKNSITITIADNNTLYLNDMPIGMIQINDENSIDSIALEKQLKELLAKNPLPVVIRADKQCSYGTIAQVLGVAQNSGAAKLELAVKTDS